MRLAVKFYIINMVTFMFVTTGIIYLFIINRLLNIKKINMSIGEHILLYLVIFQTLSIIIGIFFQLLSFYNIELEVKPFFMVEGNTNSSSSNTTTADTASSSAVTNTTTVNSTTTITQPVANVDNENTASRTVIERKIIIENGHWSDTIRTLFIYGTGFKVTMSRGNPRTKLFAVAGTITLDVLSKVTSNIINDPTYIRAQVQNWKITKNSMFSDAVDVDISQDKEFIKKISNKFLPDDLSTQIDAITQEILKNILSFFQPQTVDYPVDLLMDQHHYLAIFLFLLILLLFFFILNLAYVTALLIFKNKILSFFKNKYLLLYLKFQYNIMYFEFIFLIILVLYDFYIIIKISYFLCTYPIDVNFNK